jgi:hypothetical protein
VKRTHKGKLTDVRRVRLPTASHTVRNIGGRIVDVLIGAWANIRVSICRPLPLARHVRT